jgi:N-acetylmuramoyl-L-alanine amidase
MIMTTAAFCLAANIYFEARSESIMGQYAVALVTMNRAVEKKNVCKTVLKPHQFSWTKDKVNSRKELTDGKPKDEQAWELAKTIARTVLAGQMMDFTNGSTSYHTKAVRPSWRLAMVKTKVIGAHVFYRLA